MIHRLSNVPKKIRMGFVCKRERERERSMPMADSPLLEKL